MWLGGLLFLLFVSVYVCNVDDTGKIVFVLNENETEEKKKKIQRIQLLRILQKLRNEHERLLH